MRQGSPFCCPRKGESKGKCASEGHCQGPAKALSMSFLPSAHCQETCPLGPKDPGLVFWGMGPPRVFPGNAFLSREQLMVLCHAFRHCFFTKPLFGEKPGVEFFFDLPGVGTRAFSRAWRRQADGARLRLLPQAACPRARSRTTACQASWRWAWSCRAQPG